MVESEEKLKSLLKEGERGEWKNRLETKHSKPMIMATSAITPWQIDGRKLQVVTDFILLTPKSLQMVTAAMKLKDGFPLEGKPWQT